MIKHAWSVLCDRVVIDKDSNNLTLSVIEQVKIEYPVVELPPGGSVNFPIFGTVVSLWYRDDKDRVESTEIRVRVKTHKGKIIGQGGGTVNFQGKPHARTRTKFDTLPLPQEGREMVVFVVEYLSNKKWRKVAELPFRVQIIRGPSDQPQADQT